MDAPYNRTNFTLLGRSVPQLAAAAVALARAAVAALDLRAHAATHPRLGTVDHISCHPLPPPGGADGGATQQWQAEQQRQAEQQQQQQAEQAGLAAGEAAAAALALTIAQQLGSGGPALPVYLYGWAHPQRRPLDALRRELGYFRGATTGTWQGSLQLDPSAGAQPGEAQALPRAPCFGSAAAPVRSGVCCVGAAPWIVNYNVLLHTDDMAAARAIARGVSHRGGGMPGVQAMALRHTDGIEVACNLLQPDAMPPEAVLEAVCRLAVQHGSGGREVEVGPAYRTNKAPEELVAAALAQGL